MTLIENLTLADASAVTELSREDQSHTKAALAYLKGDHWQDGNGWVGPRLPASNPLYGEFLMNVQKQFTPKNAIKEIVNRHVGAVVGSYPVIKLALRDATAQATKSQAEEMKAGESALTAWLDTVGALSKIQKMTRLLLITPAHLRSYVPSGQLVDGQIPTADLLTSIERIRLMVPEAGSATVVDDEESGEKYAVYRLTTRTGQSAVEITGLQDGKTFVRRVEGTVSASILGPDGLPAMRDRSGKTDPLDMQGHLTITQFTRDQFVTPTLLGNNRMLNFAKTAILRNAELAAVLERYGINILPPGKWVADNQVPGGMRFEQDADYRPGGANATFFSPNTFVDEDGRTQVTSGGQYGRFEPVDPASLIATKQDAYFDMLDEAAQSHLRMTGDATASAESRIQAMNDFKVSLFATRTSVDAGLSEHLEMVLAWAASLSGDPGRFKDYRVTVQCRILAAQPTTSERTQIVAERDAGLRSTENAMSEIGIEDTDQMLEAVRIEREERLKEGQAAAAALGGLMGDVKTTGGGDGQQAKV